MKLSPYTLALGGGGARGIAHLGVLEVLERENLRPSIIVGTSMGAVIGAMYAQTLDTELMKTKIEKLFRSDFFKKIGLDFFALEDKSDRHNFFENWIRKAKRNLYLSRTLTRVSALPNEVLREALSYLLEDNLIEDCHIPFYAVATDLSNGTITVLKSGSIIRAVAASSSIPAIASPVNIEGRQLVDGGASCITPVVPARMLSDNPVVAVNVWKVLEEKKLPSRGLGVLLRAGEITQLNLNNLLVDQADIVIRPAVQHYQWIKFTRYNELIDLGRKAAEENLESMQNILAVKSRSKRKGIMNKFFGRYL